MSGTGVQDIQDLDGIEIFSSVFFFWTRKMKSDVQGYGGLFLMDGSEWNTTNDTFGDL